MSNCFQWVAGWGRSSTNIFDRGNLSRTAVSTDILNQLQVPLVDIEKCKAVFNNLNVNAENHICAGGEEGLKNIFFKNGQNPASFCLFLFFSIDKHYTNTINEKSIDGVLGTRTQGGRMVGEDKSTELWRHPKSRIFGLHKLKKIFKLFHLVIDF